MEQIRQCSELIPEPCHDLARLDLYSAVKTLDDLLAETFIVTTSVARTLHTFYHQARANLHLRYRSEKDYYSVLLSRRFPDGTFPAICFTGLAGVGKSRILTALGHLLRYQDPTFQPVSGVEIELQAYLHIPVKSGKSSTAIFEKIYANLISDGRERTMLRKAASVVQTEAFRRGLILVSIDELQHLTLSASANTLVTGVLLSILESGIPFIYGCNYSLVHRLILRNQEDQDRLLRAIVEQRPEPVGSLDWSRIVDTMLGVAPDAFRLTSKSQGELLADLSLCVPRMLRDLLLIGYRRARGAGRNFATADDIQRAYQSVEFSSMRNNIEEIRRQRVIGTIKRVDLVMPSELVDRIEERESQERERQLDKLRSRSILAGSLTVPERKGVQIAVSSSNTVDQGQRLRPRKEGIGGRVSEEDLRVGLDFVKRRKH
jgi:hypothetical protein